MRLKDIMKIATGILISIIIANNSFASSHRYDTYNISGIVYDNYGTGLGEVDVGYDSNSVKTNESGYYLITGLANGTHGIIYSKTGFESNSSVIKIDGVNVDNVNVWIFDTTPPAQVTGLRNDIPTQTTVNITRNKILDANYYKIFRDLNIIGITNNTYWNDSGLNPDTTYEYKVRANDSYDNWGENSTDIPVRTSSQDNIPPESISNLQMTTGNFYINNAWTNPIDSDFSYVLFKYDNGSELTKVYSPINSLNITDLEEHYNQNISAQTVDTTGNINDTKVWFNITIPNNDPKLTPIGYKNKTTGELLTFTVGAIDQDNDILTYTMSGNNIKGYLDPNTGIYSWQTTDADIGQYQWTFSVADSYGGVDSETINVVVIYVPLSIVSLSPDNDPETTKDTPQSFAIGLNKTANVTWYINDTQTQTDIGSFVIYNNWTAGIGKHKVRVTATNGTDTVSRMWNWTVKDKLPINYIPPKPKNLQYEFSNLSANFTWQEGIGDNKTDLYNVTYINASGKYVRNIVDIFIRVSGSPHGSVGVFVYAYNSSGSGSLSTENINANVQIPNNPPVITGDKTVTAGNFLNFTVATDIDGDNLKYGDTNVTKGTFNNVTGAYSWQISNGDIGTYKWYFNVNDNYGGIVNKTITITVKQDTGTGNGGTGGSSGGGSSGGSSGGGTSGEDFYNIDFKERKELSIYNDKVTSYVFTDKKNPIRYINITGNMNAGDVTGTVEVLKNKSSLLKQTQPPGFIYKNINIWIGSSNFATPRNIKSATITFRVDNSWLDENNMRKYINMVRNSGGKWITLDTTEKMRDDNYTYFEVDTDGFTHFAITGLTKKEKIIESTDIKYDQTISNQTIIISNQTSIKSKPTLRKISGFDIIISFSILLIAYSFLRHNKK